MLYRKVASNEPLSTFYVHIVLLSNEIKLIRVFLIDIFKLLQMQMCFYSICMGN